MLLRIILAVIISGILSLVLMPVLIKYLHKWHFGQSIRLDGPKSHLKKQGTPIMGGIGFILITLVVTLVLTPKSFTNPEFLIVILAFIGYGLIGFWDDFLVVIKHNNDGLKPKFKLLLQSLLAIIFFLVYIQFEPTEVIIPFTHIIVNLGWFYAVLVFVMFTGETNAVNFADGMDGLCSGLMCFALVPYVLFAYKAGNQGVAVLLSSLIGSLIGYLYYNKYPAKVMMGDTGSLALGGILAASAMVLKQELSLLIIGGVFLAEMLSVVIQVGYFKLSHGKRVFRMAPLHHHFELGGVKETTVVRRFWLVGALLSVIGILMGMMA